MFRHNITHILVCIVMTSLLFFLLSLPQTYQLSNKIVGTYTKSGPTFKGISIHTLFFACCLIIIKLSYFKLSKEGFITCGKDDYVMEPDVDGRYIDINEIKSPYGQMGNFGCKWPYDEKYIPKKDKKWCMKKVN